MEDLETKDEVYSSVISQIESIKEQMDDLDKYFNDLPNKQSQVDEELSDLLHYIENNDLTPKQSLKMIKLIKEKRLIRRGLCNDNEIKRVYNNNRNKLAIDSQRPFFSSEINKKAKELNQQYRYRRFGLDAEDMQERKTLAEEEIKNLLK